MRTLILFFWLACSALANDIVFYNPNSFPVTNRVVSYVKSLNEPDWVGKSGALIITNAEAQRGSGVTLTNLDQCVVSNQTVRLMNSFETSLISSNNTWQGSNSTWQAKVDARTYATNVMNGTDGLSLFIRAMGEANWFYLNQIRTNDGKPALTKSAYKNLIDGYIDAFGQ